MSHEHVIGNYRISRSVLGKGSFATVRKGSEQKTGREVAVKVIPLQKLNAQKKFAENLESEIAILKSSRHQNIVEFLDIQKDNHNIYIFLEFCAGGDLSKFIRDHGPVTEDVARKFLRQLACGLGFLRKANLIHRDLKPQNLLLTSEDENATLKIADFGFARYIEPQNLADTLCGSPLYMAPEILKSQKYDAKADLWSVGAILYELLYRSTPFSGSNHVELQQNIEKNEVRFPDNKTVSPCCLDLLKMLLKRNPVERCSFEDFFQHEFISGVATSTPVVYYGPPLAGSKASDSALSLRTSALSSSSRLAAGITPPPAKQTPQRTSTVLLKDDLSLSFSVNRLPKPRTYPFRESQIQSPSPFGPSKPAASPTRPHDPVPGPERLQPVEARRVASPEAGGTQDSLDKEYVVLGSEDFCDPGAPAPPIARVQTPPQAPQQQLDVAALLPAIRHAADLGIAVGLAAERKLELGFDEEALVLFVRALRHLDACITELRALQDHSVRPSSAHDAAADFQDWLYERFCEYVAKADTVYEYTQSRPEPDVSAADGLIFLQALELAKQAVAQGSVGDLQGSARKYLHAQLLLEFLLCQDSLPPRDRDHVLSYLEIVTKHLERVESRQPSAFA